MIQAHGMPGQWNGGYMFLSDRMVTLFTRATPEYPMLSVT